MTFQELYEEGCKYIEINPMFIPRYCFVSIQNYNDLVEYAKQFTIYNTEGCQHFQIFLPTGYVELIPCKINDFSFGV